MDDAQIVLEKLIANRMHREAMIALFASGEAIGFLGAGLSIPLKYPSWDKLLGLLEEEAAKLGPLPALPSRPLERAAAIKAHFLKFNARNDYMAILGREFAPREKGENCTETHKRIIRLPFCAFVTTNYDDCGEHALQYFSDKPGNTNPGIIIKAQADRHRVSRFLRSIARASEHRHIAHLHGRHEDTENIILTEGDYLSAYGIPRPGQDPTPPATVTLHRQLLWSLFAMRRMVFIGCSMTDPYIKVLLDLVACDLWERGTTVHYVILGLDQKSLGSAESTAAEFSRYGLQVVYYDNLAGDHANLDKLLDEAAARRTPAVSPPAAPTSPARAVTLPTAAPQLDWMEEVNQRLAKETPE